MYLNPVRTVLFIKKTKQNTLAKSIQCVVIKDHYICLSITVVLFMINKIHKQLTCPLPDGGIKKNMLSVHNEGLEYCKE